VYVSRHDVHSNDFSRLLTFSYVVYINESCCLCLFDVVRLLLLHVRCEFVVNN
jgi:hypothetical protein